MLHITSAETAAEAFRRARLPGQILIWRDALHEGPLLEGVTLSALSRIRAQFLADAGEMSLDEALMIFARRDKALAEFYEHDEVVLWFERDLPEQLALLQLLHWFSDQDLEETRLSLIGMGTHPEASIAQGLNSLKDWQMAWLFENRREVTAQQLALGRQCWQAFCAPDPSALESLQQQDTCALPFVRDALQDRLEQFPSLANGLSQTEQQILQTIQSGITEPVDVIAVLQRHTPKRLSLAVFWSSLNRLVETPTPLLKTPRGGKLSPPGTAPFVLDRGEQSLRLTPTGFEVLSNRQDWFKLKGGNHWLGGAYLAPGNLLWRWDALQGRLVQTGV
jgi:hypothetical protein